MWLLWQPQSRLMVSLPRSRVQTVSTCPVLQSLTVHLVTAPRSKWLPLRRQGVILIISSGCGSQADTAIIRDREIASGKATPLGRTQGNGPVNAAVMVAAFMGTGTGAAPPTNQGASGSVGVEDNIPQNAQGRDGAGARRRQLFGGLFGGGGAGGAGGNAGATGITGLLGGGGTKAEGPPEARVAAAAGAGASSGLPTCADDGTVTMTLRQVNQDGAGPFNAAVDGTSGGVSSFMSSLDPMLTKPRLMKLLCSLQPSLRTFLVLGSRVSLWLPAPNSK